MNSAIWGLMAMVFFISAMNAQAAGTGSSSWSKQEQENKPAVSLYDQGVEASKNKDFQKALGLFERALMEDSNNPDILNMLAHAQLKVGRIDTSISTYKKALALRSRFAEAREYLGEAYIEAAKREIEALKSYGSAGAESLEELRDAFKKAAAQL